MDWTSECEWESHRKGELNPSPSTVERKQVEQRKRTSRDFAEKFLNSVNCKLDGKTFMRKLPLPTEKDGQEQRFTGKQLQHVRHF